MNNNRTGAAMVWTTGWEATRVGAPMVCTTGAELRMTPALATAKAERTTIAI